MFIVKNTKFDQTTISLLCIKTKSGAHKQLTYYFQMRKHFCKHLHSSLFSMQKSDSSFDSNQKPVDVRLTNFKQARISHSISDVITLMMTSMGPKVRFRQILRGRCFVPLHLLHFFCKIQHCPSPINIKHYYIFPSVYLSVCLQI